MKTGSLRDAFASIRADLDSDAADAALAGLKQVMSVDPLSRDALLLLGEYFWRKRQVDRARTATRWLTVSAPDIWAGWANLASLADYRGVSGDLVAQQRRAMLIGGARAGGLLRRMSGDATHDKILPAARAMLCLMPRDPETLLLAARAEAAITSIEAASRRLGQAAVAALSAPGDVKTIALLAGITKASGRAWLTRERPAAAAKALRRAILLGPGDADAAFELGRARFEVGDSADAGRHLARSLLIAPGDHGVAGPPPKSLLNRHPADLPAHAGYLYRQVAAGFKVRIMPRGAPAPRIEYAVPSTFLARLDDARLLGDMHAVVTPTDDVLVEGLTYRQPRRTWNGANFPYLAADGRVMAMLPGPEPRIEGAAVLLGGGPNFYHCMIDWLSRVPTLLDTPDLADLPVLVSDRIPQAIAETLTLLGIHGDRLHFVGSGLHPVDRLWIPSLAHGRLSCVSPRYLEFLEERLFRRFRDPGIPGRRRLFFSRGDSARRNIGNAGALAALLDRFGFESVSMGELSASAQFAIAGEAEVIVAPHGAALANVLAAPKATPIIELTHAKAIRPVIPILAGLREQPYHRIIGAPRAGAPGVDLHAGFDVPLDQLEPILRRVLG